MAVVGELFDKVWNFLTKSLDTEIVKKWKDTVCTMYGDSLRYYHTLKHIEEMLSYRNSHLDKLKDGDAVDYAIIFHDIVYNPKAPDNEEQSAVLFEDFANEVSLQDSLKEKVCEMILATKQHKTPEHNTDTGGNEDIHYLLDFDMAVLGRPCTAYKEYANQIRQEYIHIPEKIFCDKRAEVLATFLQVPYIYATSIFRELCEKQARQNIQREIEDLKVKSAAV